MNFQKYAFRKNLINIVLKILLNNYQHGSVP
jgi:hypothetical protein